MMRNYLKKTNFGLNLIFGLVTLSAIFHFFKKKDEIFGAEFLIMYRHGLVKRGFVGSILYTFCSNLNFDNEFIIKFTMIILLIINLVLIFCAIILKKLDWIIIASSFFLLNIYSQHIAFRLDLLLIPLLFVQFLILKSDNFKLNFKIILTSIILCFGVAIHEVYFLIIFFILFYILKFDLNVNRIKSYLIVFLPGFIVFVLMVTLYRGNLPQALEIVSSWEKLGLQPEKLDYLKWLFSLNKPIYIWDNAAFIKSKWNYVGFAANYIVVCGIFYSYLAHHFKITRNAKDLILANFALLLFLCFFATDFIRWYYLIFLSVLFYFIIFQKKSKQTVNVRYISLKLCTLFVGLPMYGWTITHFYWTSPVKYLIDFKDYL